MDLSKNFYFCFTQLKCYEDFEKASLYFQKTEEAIKKYPAPIAAERLTKAKQELQLCMEGKYYDILTELEARENVDH